MLPIIITSNAHGHFVMFHIRLSSDIRTRMIRLQRGRLLVSLLPTATCMVVQEVTGIDALVWKWIAISLPHIYIDDSIYGLLDTTGNMARFP